LFSSSLCLTSIISFLYFYSFHLRLLPIPCIHNITIAAATFFHRLHPSMCVHQWINVKLETSKLSPNELSCCIKEIIHFHWWYWWMDDCRNEKIFLLYGETETKKTCRHDFRDFQSYFEEFLWKFFLSMTFDFHFDDSAFHCLNLSIDESSFFIILYSIGIVFTWIIKQLTILAEARNKKITISFVHRLMSR